MSFSNVKIKLGLAAILFIAFGFLFRINTIEEIAKAPEIKEVKEVEKIKKPEFVSMIFAGDIMLDRGVRSSVLKNFDGDYAKLFENLEMLKDFDIAFLNLEGPASDKGQNMRNLYSFRMDPVIIGVLENSGIDIVSVANNHVGDWRREAYIDTLARLKDSKILSTGGGINSLEAEEPAIFYKNGIKIGFLGFSDVGPDWMKATEEEAGLLIARNPRFDEIIKNAAEKVDYLIVSFHFGDEYKVKHNARQEYLAHKAVDNGAKIVIGHHPHVPQDTEVYKDGLIAYSLGNFIFDQSWSEPTMRGLLLEVKLNKNGSILTRRNDSKLNNFFQPGEIIKGEEKIYFQ